MNIVHKLDPRIKEVELRNAPIYIRVNKFTEDAAKKFADDVSKAHNTGQTVIPVVIDSYGGQVYSLMAMISAIKAAHLPIATIISGKAMSCGAILFSFGSEGMRYVDQDATVMIHDVSSFEKGKVEEIKASAEETERLNQKVYEMMALNCGKHKNYFLEIVHDRGHADWFLDADEVLKHNLANYIGVPRLEVEVTVSFNFYA
jgi:ATP-dependent Clp protease protease subunit